jgi:hypothetical protein
MPAASATPSTVRQASKREKCAWPVAMPAKTRPRKSDDQSKLMRSISHPATGAITAYTMENRDDLAVLSVES